MAYRWVATSVAGFVQQLAVSYVGHGYWFYVQGQIPDGKDLTGVDRKLLGRYEVEVSKWTRARHKKVGKARIQYLRLDRQFVLVATRGEHPFFEAEKSQIRDIRRVPLKFAGYAIGCRRGRDRDRWHPSVRIERSVFHALKRRFREMALQRSADDLAAELRRLPFEPYAPVLDQVRQLLRAVNRRRKAAGLELVSTAVSFRRRAPVRPFG